MPTFLPFDIKKLVRKNNLLTNTHAEKNRNSPFFYWSINELHKHYAKHSLSPVEVTLAILRRVALLDPKLHSFQSIAAEKALTQAKTAEKEIMKGNVRGLLHGIPIALKDIFDTKGIPTACGMKIFKDRLPSKNATVVDRLENAGAIILGKLTMTEGAFSAHHPTIAPPVNPWNPNLWTGVSSSGCGVATAAGLCYATLGTDTAGSIRSPSACNGVVGLKPTYGRVSRYGVFPLAPTLDHVGPMARTVSDAAIMLQAIAGYDPKDPYSSTKEVPNYSSSLNRKIKGTKIGLDERYCFENVDEKLVKTMNSALKVLEQCGAVIQRVNFPKLYRELTKWLGYVSFEAAKAHQKTFPAQSHEYGPMLRQLLQILEARKTLAPETYKKTRELARSFKKDLGRLFEEIDIVICPSIPMASPPALLTESIALDPNAALERSKFAVPFNFSGNPTISLPCGFSSKNCPLSLQLVGRHWQEDLILEMAYHYEQSTNWHRRHPPMNAL